VLNVLELANFHASLVCLSYSFTVWWCIKFSSYKVCTTENCL